VLASDRVICWDTGMKRLVCGIVFLCLSLPAARADRWLRYEDCKLVTDAYFDGDSFHVKVATGYTYIFRLYGVDCPETDKQVPQRLAEQEKDFGVTREELLQWGRKAKEFTRNFLSQPFTVHTKKEQAMGQSDKNRYYCVIVGKGTRRLDEELVRAGLARVHGQGADWPERVGKDEFLTKLHPLESKAKRDRQGIWKK
jgi:endonuclease YncB( thermonuclease family)